MAAIRETARQRRGARTPRRARPTWAASRQDFPEAPEHFVPGYDVGELSEIAQRMMSGSPGGGGPRGAGRGDGDQGDGGIVDKAAEKLGVEEDRGS